MLTFDKRTDDTATSLEDIPRETLCKVGGVAVTIPIEVPPTVPVAYLRTRMLHGPDTAVVWAMELLMTTEGLNLFLRAQITEDDLDTITAEVIKRVSGASTGKADITEAPKASPVAAKTSPQRRRTSGTASRATKKSS